MKFGKVLTTVALGVALVTVKPPIQYATTSDSENPFKHSMNKLATTIGVMTPHQDTFTATMQSDMGIDAGVANYRTYFKAGETLNIKITFTSTVQELLRILQLKMIMFYLNIQYKMEIMED